MEQEFEELRRQVGPYPPDEQTKYGTCPISGRIAKFLDPLTGHRYGSVEAFQVLRQNHQDRQPPKQQIKQQQPEQEQQLKQEQEPDSEQQQTKQHAGTASMNGDTSVKCEVPNNEVAASQ